MLLKELSNFMILKEGMSRDELADIIDGAFYYKDGIYICSEYPILSENDGDDLISEDEAKNAEIAEKINNGTIKIFRSYSSYGHSELCWVDGDVKDITPKSFDPYLFHNYDNALGHENMLEDAEEMISELRSKYGNAIANAVKSHIGSYFDDGVFLSSTLASKILLVVATDD